mgnify:FL=1
MKVGLGMVRGIKLLDCTLRDGGYVNDWEFGNGAMTCIFDRLNVSGIDIIEIGFLDQRRQPDQNRTIQPDTESMTKAFSKISDRKTMVVAMIDYGTCDIENLQPRSETVLDGIRVIFKKENMHKAVEFGREVMEKGYALFLNMVSITSYEAEDIIEFSEDVNRIKPFAVSLVDTYGLMHKEQMSFYFNLLDKHLDPSISIGYHSHNNFQLAYSNTIEVLELNTKRDIILDGSLYGMGKSAGNAPLELLAMHLNENYGKNYDVNQILEAIDVNIMPMYEKHYWGYSFYFYISAKNDCHPNYVKHLVDKRSLSIKAVNEILGKIEYKRKLAFDKQYIEGLYMEYMLDNLDDSECIEDLSKELSGRELLLIGPGKSADRDRTKIKAFMEDKAPIAVAVNFIPSVGIDYLFVSNSKRYSLMVPNIIDCGLRTIATSNITPIREPFDYTVEYGGLITDTDEIWDNALVILLNLLKKIGVDKVYLAGFDGFSESSDTNYIDESFDLSKSFEYLSAVNRLLTKKIKEYRKDMNIVFLTDSIYSEE